MNLFSTALLVLIGLILSAVVFLNFEKIEISKKTRNILITIIVALTLIAIIVILIVDSKAKTDMPAVDPAPSSYASATVANPSATLSATDLSEQNSTDEILLVRFRVVKVVGIIHYDVGMTYQYATADGNKEVIIKGFDAKGSLLWEANAEYVGDNLYFCYLPTMADNLSANIDGSNITRSVNHEALLEVLNTTNAYYTIEDYQEEMYTLIWYEDDINIVKTITSLEFEHDNEYIPITINHSDPDFSIHKLSLLDGSYRFDYIDGSNEIIKITDNYFFTK